MLDDEHWKLTSIFKIVLRNSIQPNSNIHPKCLKTHKNQAI